MQETGDEIGIAEDHHHYAAAIELGQLLHYWCG